MLILSFVATRVALERVEGLRLRLSSMDPFDGPVSAYSAAQQELLKAEIDLNYCQFFPINHKFCPPPYPSTHNFKPMEIGSRKEYRCLLWNIVEQCMKEGTLQDLKDGKIPVGRAEYLKQTSPAQTEQANGHKDLQLSAASDSKQVQVLGRFAPHRMLSWRIQEDTNVMICRY